MKINHMICPNCGHDFYTDAAYGTCDACNCMFYAAQSRTCKPCARTLPMANQPATIPPEWAQKNS